LVEEKEGFPIVGAVIYTNRFTLYTRANGDLSVALPPKRFTLEVGFTVQVCPPVSKGGEGGGFSEKVVGSPGVQGPIVDARRRRVGSEFCSRHDERKLRKTRKGRNKGSARGKLWCETKKPRKPYSRENPEIGKRRRCRRIFETWKYKQSQEVINARCTIPAPGVDQRSKSTHGGTPQGTQGRKVNRLTTRGITQMRRRPRKASPKKTSPKTGIT